MRDIAEFFTRKKGEKLAGKPLDERFLRHRARRHQGRHDLLGSLWCNFIKNYGGDIIDASGKPTFDTPENSCGAQDVG